MAGAASWNWTGRKASPGPDRNPTIAATMWAWEMVCRSQRELRPKATRRARICPPSPAGRG
jgi:hypothetical protein